MADASRRSLALVMAGRDPVVRRVDEERQAHGLLAPLAEALTASPVSQGMAPIPATDRAPPMAHDELRGERPTLLPMARYESGHVRPAVPGFLRDMYDAMTLPGDVYRGRREPTPEGALGMALELGPAGVAGSRFTGDVGTLGMFVPASAAVRRKAEAMEAAGKSADEIWQTVGAERGVDGRWLEEIDDSKAVFADTNLPTDATLGDVMHHPELYERVPGLDALPVRPTSDGAGSLVPESMGGPRMELNPRLPLEDPGMRRQARSEARRAQRGTQHVGDLGSLPKDRREVTLHETMHDLQERYGMPVGDSPRGIEEYLQGLERAKGASQEELDMIDGDFFYPRSAGEVQARNVPRRLFGMTAEERQRVRPALTEDVPREDQIVRYRSGGPQR